MEQLNKLNVDPQRESGGNQTKCKHQWEIGSQKTAREIKIMILNKIMTKHTELDAWNP